MFGLTTPPAAGSGLSAGGPEQQRRIYRNTVRVGLGTRLMRAEMRFADRVFDRGSDTAAAAVEPEHDHPRSSVLLAIALGRAAPSAALPRSLRVRHLCGLRMREGSSRSSSFEMALSSRHRRRDLARQYPVVACNRRLTLAGKAADVMCWRVRS